MSGYLGAGAGHWERVHRRRPPNELTWYQPRPDLSLRFIELAGIGPSDRIVDVGGGSSRLCDELMELGFMDITVVDISSTALGHVLARNQDHADRLTLVEDDVGGFRATEPFALWHDRAVFHFLTDAKDRERYRAAVQANIEEGGFVAMATFGRRGPDTCSGLPVQRYDHDTLSKTLGNWLQPVAFEEEFHSTPAGGTQHFIYGLFRRSA